MTGITLVLVIAAVLGFELYLRASETRVVRDRIATSADDFGRNPENLIDYTPSGRQWAPNARVTIRNHWLSEKDVRIEINSLGFRDDEIPIEKPPGETRVIVLGDSITAADYLDSEQTFVEIAERRLNRGLERGHIELVNTAISNTGLEEQVRTLEERALVLKPDAVVVCFYLNDSRPPWGFAGEIGDGGWLRRNSILADTIYRRYRLKQWQKEQYEIRFEWIDAKERLDWKHDPSELQELARLARYDWGAAWEDESWESLRPHFERLSALSKEHGFEVGIMAFPVSFQVYAEFVDDGPQRKLANLAKEHAFRLRDMLPVFRERRGRELFYDQCHPNEEANAFLGGELENLVREILAMPPE